MTRDLREFRLNVGVAEDTYAHLVSAASDAETKVIYAEPEARQRTFGHVFYWFGVTQECPMRVELPNAQTVDAMLVHYILNVDHEEAWAALRTSGKSCRWCTRLDAGGDGASFPPFCPRLFV